MNREGRTSEGPMVRGRRRKERKRTEKEKTEAKKGKNGETERRGAATTARAQGVAHGEIVEGIQPIAGAGSCREEASIFYTTCGFG